ncbi:hypothetical protein EYF80_054066 [Liparis tanakae]|uniref:Uncharacterized protein n=1 Tax=Liparis tanakae TaxID=230148 RepID=A0A4Z2F3H0_9TELE|nr:hypothetical protein EYF80_054066 [Liparis tanakae]
MSKAQILRRLVNQRLTAAAQEICGLLEGAMSEYEEELCALKEENQRNRKLLHAALNPEVRVPRAGPSSPRTALSQRTEEVFLIGPSADVMTSPHQLFLLLTLL